MYGRWSCLDGNWTDRLPCLGCLRVLLIGGDYYLRELGMRRRPLPAYRESTRQRVTIGKKRLYLDVGFYKDGTVGEVFINVEKTGSDLRALLDTVARLISVGLQSGVALERYVEMLEGTRFEPAGIVTGHPRIKFASSPLDFVARFLGVEYLQRDDLAHIKEVEVL